MINSLPTKAQLLSTKIRGKSNFGDDKKNSSFQKRLLALKHKDTVNDKDSFSDKSSLSDKESFSDNEPFNNKISIEEEKYTMDDKSVSLINAESMLKKQTVQEPDEKKTQADPVGLIEIQAQPASPLILSARSSVRIEAFDATTANLIKQFDAVSQLDLIKKSDWHFQQVGPNSSVAGIRLTQLENGAWVVNVSLPHLQGQKQVAAADALKQHLLRRGHRIDSLNMDVTDDADTDT